MFRYNGGKSYNELATEALLERYQTEVQGNNVNTLTAFESLTFFVVGAE